MRAVIHPRYGAPEVLRVAAHPQPNVGPDTVLVRIEASPITYGDRRVRAADYPGVGRLLGRLVTGLVRPRHPVPGTAFAGVVEAVGAAVTAYAPGDRVFGLADHGAHAELLALPAAGTLAKMPPGLSFTDAAALPYGALTAQHFLHLGGVRPGHSVLVLGAAGGVGRYAVQLAKALGATVTGVCAGRNLAQVIEWGADHVVDYQREDWAARGQRYDVVFDTASVARFCDVRPHLTRDGRFLTLSMSLRVLALMGLTRFMRRRALFSISLGSAAEMATLAAQVEAGRLRAAVYRQLPLAQVVEAHREAERPGSRGEVVLVV